MGRAKLTCGFEGEQVTRRRAMWALCSAGIVACGPWQRVGSPDRSPPGVNVAQLFDAGTVYRAMGFLVGGPALPFVGTVRYLRAATPDSTLALCALSLANTALTFRRNGNEFIAEYHVERSEEHTSELQSLAYLVCRLLLEKKKKETTNK